MSPVFEPRDGCAVVIALCGGAALDACLARLRGEVGRCIVVLRDDQAAPQSGIAAAAQAPQAQNLHLALVGDLAGDGFHANAEEVLTQVAAPDMPARRVHCTGFVDDADLIALYSDALAVALPSFSEGFGLPALEAMACGTPVLCSREGALPEVVGGGGLSFDPHDPSRSATRSWPSAAPLRGARCSRPRRSSGLGSLPGRARPAARSRCSRPAGRRVPPQLWRYTGLVRRSVRTVDLLLSPSAYTAERHREAGLEAPLAVLPLFSALAPPEDTEAVAENGVFLCVGRVVASKGIAELADAFATLPQLVLLVAGDGPQQAEIERRFGRAANIRFLGRVPQHELVPLYRSATALILPPLAPESFGLSVVEAFACGRSAIVRTAGGAPELIETTGGGIVYRDQDELRAALRQLSGDAGARATLARRARAAFCGTMPRRSTSTAISRVATPFARAKGWHQGAMRAILTFHSIDRFRLGSVLSAPAVRPSAGASRAPRRAGGRPRLAARPEDP